MKREFEHDELHWYALDVTRQKEYVAGLIFNRLGWVTFIPTATRFRKRSRYVKSELPNLEVAYPALPGVVFVGFPRAPEWFRVMSIHLVNGVLSTDDRPRRIDTASKDWLRYRAHQLDGQLVVERHKMLHRGTEVERSAALVQVQGRGVIRSPLTIKNKASSDRPLAVQPHRGPAIVPLMGERARIIYSLFGSPPSHVRTAA